MEMNKIERNLVARCSLLSPLTAVGCVLILCLMGCGQSGDTNKAQDQGLLPEAVTVRKAFRSANPSSQGPVEETLRLVKAGAANPSAYTEAVPLIQKLAANPSISAEQKLALEALAEKLKSELAGRKP